MSSKLHGRKQELRFAESNAPREGQFDFGDRFFNLDERSKSLLEQSKYEVFRKMIYPNIDVESYMPLFTEEGCSASTVRDLVTLIILQAEENLTVDQLILRTYTDVAFQYVLGTTGSNVKQPVSRSNYFKFLERIEQYEDETGVNLIQHTVQHITNVIGSEMGFNLHQSVDGFFNKVRMDSMLITSYSQHLTRAGIVYRCNCEALNVMVQTGGLEAVPSNLIHYFNSDDMNRVIYHDTTEGKEKLAELLKESVTILALMSDECWKEFQEYKNLERVISDQGVVDKEGNIAPKAGTEIKGTSLQSPEDPEATARTKNGKTVIGYAVNFAEIYDGNGNSLIIDADIQSSVYSDARFGEDFIGRKDPDSPWMVLTHDGAFFSAENLEKAEEAGIILVPTVLTGIQTNTLCAEFNLDDQGTKVETCPNGNAPVMQTFNEETGKINAKFDKEQCAKCPHREECPYREQAKFNKIEISQETIDRAEFQANFGMEEHKEASHERNGVEAIPSIMRRKYEIDHFRTFRKSVRRLKLFGAVLCYNCQKFLSFTKTHRGYYAQL